MRELHEAERLEQIRDRPQHLNLLVGGLVDTGADDREGRMVLSQPQGDSKRLRVGRLDDEDVRFGHPKAFEERRLVTEASYDRRIQPPNVVVGFDDQEKSHDHVVVDGRMFSRVG
jgi:hypothetical protein